MSMTAAAARPALAATRAAARPRPPSARRAAGPLPLPTCVRLGAPLPLPSRRPSLRVSAGEEDPIAPLDVSSMVTDLTDTSELGKRGELYFIGQFALLGGACLGLPGAGDQLAQLLAVLAGGAGLAVALVAVGDLGNSLSPLPKPRESNKLCTSGMYRYVRHPMYSGLLGIGFAAVTFSFAPSKLLMLAGLLALLDAKAGIEEGYMREVHGEDTYGAYCEEVGKFVPKFRR